MKTFKGPIKKIKKEKAGSYNKKKGPTVFKKKKKQDLGIVFMDGIVFFKLSSHIIEF